MAKIKIKMDAIKTKKFNMDAVSLDVEENEAPGFEKLMDKICDASKIIMDQEEKNAEMEKEKNALTGSNEQLKDEIEAMKKDIEELKNPNSDAVAEIVKEKKDLDEVADAVGLGEEEKKTDSNSLKISIIKKRSSNFYSEGKSEDYINARYDAIKEIVLSEKKNDKDIINLGNNINNKKREDSKVKDPRAEFIKKSQDMHKQEEK